MEIPEFFNAATGDIYTSAILSCTSLYYGQINRSLVKISYLCPLFIFGKISH